MNRFFILFIVGITLITLGCSTPSKTVTKKQEISEQKSSVDIQNRNPLNKEHLSPVVPGKRSGPHINNNLSLQKDTSKREYKRGIKVLKKDELRKFESEKRVALVIGNSDYKISSLRNPVNDALAVSNVLKKLDFEVLVGTNLRQKGMKRLIDDFGAKIKNGGVGLFYYAGHGMQVNGRNYLIPIDAKIESENEVDIVSVRADEILVKMDDANNRLNIVILDACRNNPFARSFRSSTQGLATMDSPSGTIIAYATAPGSVASDGPGDNGLYTHELIENMQIPDLKIEDMFKKVRTSVKLKTNDQQVPWESSSLEGDFYFSLSSIILAKKMKKTTAEQLRLKKEIEQLELLEAKAQKADDARAKRNAELQKKTALAKLKAEELRQKQLEEEQKKLVEMEKIQLQRKNEIETKKREQEARIAALKQAVQEKREQIGETTLESLSPEKTISEMIEIDTKIKEIKKSYRQELVTGVKAITKRINKKFIKINNTKKDEFESKEEFLERISTEKRNAEKEQTKEINVIARKIQEAYVNATAPFLENLRKLSKSEFTLTSDKLILNIHQYDATSNTYPITVKVKQAINGIMVEVKANIPISRDEARIFKQHFQNNMLRPVIIGNFQSLEFFRVTHAIIIDDATDKRYNIFDSAFVDLGNGIILDTRTNLLWTKNAQIASFKSSKNWFSNDTFDKDLNMSLAKIEVSGLKGWQVPDIENIKNLSKNLSLKNNKHFFDNFDDVRVSRSGCSYSGFLAKKESYRSGGTIDEYIVYSVSSSKANRLCTHRSHGPVIWPVHRGSSSSYGHFIDDGTLKQYDLFASEFFDLGDGTVLDIHTKLLWSKNAQNTKFVPPTTKRGYENTFYEDLRIITSKIDISGLKGWRVPNYFELNKMSSLKNKKHPFIEINGVRMSTSGCSDSGFLVRKDSFESGGTIDGYKTYAIGSGNSNRLCGFGRPRLVIWPIRGIGSGHDAR